MVSAGAKGMTNPAVRGSHRLTGSWPARHPIGDRAGGARRAGRCIERPGDDVAAGLGGEITGEQYAQAGQVQRDAPPGCGPRRPARRRRRRNRAYLHPPLRDQHRTATTGSSRWPSTATKPRNGSDYTPVPEPELVTSGPCRFVRHPIYSGLLTAMPGIALVNNLLGLIRCRGAGRVLLLLRDRRGAEPRGHLPHGVPGVQKQDEDAHPVPPVGQRMGGAHILVARPSSASARNSASGNGHLLGAACQPVDFSGYSQRDPRR
jgi:hypothetical protein